MATKKEVEELNAEIARLKELVWTHETEIAKLKSTEDVLGNKLFILDQTNKYLQESNERLIRSNNLNQQTNTNLLQAISVLGNRELKRIEDEIWHSCNPSYSQMEATNAQKPL